LIFELTRVTSSENITIFSKNGLNRYW
jgi:hypothetical protein